LKAIVRYILLVALFGFCLSNFALRNLNAPNPTGRRYSSETPLTTAQGSSNAIGRSGEDLLAKDLGLPNNNAGGQNQCICGNSTSSRCKTCLISLPSLSTYRMPDFVGQGFLAESKNEQGLYYSGREVNQLNDYVLAAILMRVKLWVFVRVDTEVAIEFTRLVQSTGGDVVYYFKTQGYFDPLERGLWIVSLVSSVVLLVIGLGLVIQYRIKNPPLALIPLSPKPPRAPKPVPDPTGKVIRKTDAAEDFAQRAKEKRQREIDIDDSRDDLR
jgi:hypothetical protein